MSNQEIHVELLMGKKVYALNGKSLGRIEEVRVDVREGETLVSEYLVGTYAFFERLSSLEIARAILGIFGSLVKGGYRVRWDQLDLKNPERPMLTCQVSELLPLEREQ